MYKKIIEEIMNVYNLNASELAQKIDVQRSGISHILSGRNNPSIDFIIKMKEQFPDIQWDYLIKGEGAMFVTNVNNEENSKEMSIDLFSNVPQEQKEGMDIKKPHDIKSIVWFYEDGSFDIFKPNKD